jgi:hypothetical protein
LDPFILLINPHLPTFSQLSPNLWEQILELQIFSWIINGVPSIPLRAPTRLLAIPIIFASEPFKFPLLLLSACPQVKNVFHCNFSTLNIIPKNESCFIAIAQKQFSKAEQLYIFQPYNAKTVLPIQPNLYLIYLETMQFPVCKCNSYLWNQTCIEAGISLNIVPLKCELNLQHHQIMANKLITSSQFCIFVKIIQILFQNPLILHEGMWRCLEVINFLINGLLMCSISPRPLTGLLKNLKFFFRRIFLQKFVL